MPPRKTQDTDSFGNPIKQGPSRTSERLSNTASSTGNTQSGKLGDMGSQSKMSSEGKSGLDQMVGNASCPSA
ncbi:hypothetical protein M011DRAFT_47358 [Sporormia fimetaria CBS 119925]|uniref:Uncharacterized protein n=1 Tax=Sporormia fimetaria CBS 119925 TaxID=1340428 RepID=A0A6A6VAA8_9PLEO|nr:hypothetical protein M011DRAFT_47358 [Sporormia fimetaria CBS 119925]